MKSLLSGISLEPWPHRAPKIIQRRLEQMGFPETFRALQSLGAPIERATIDFMAEATDLQLLACALHLLTFPDEANRLCYLPPSVQRAELTRITQPQADINRPKDQHAD